VLRWLVLPVRDDSRPAVFRRRRSDDSHTRSSVRFSFQGPSGNLLSRFGGAAL